MNVEENSKGTALFSGGVGLAFKSSGLEMNRSDETVGNTDAAILVQKIIGIL